MSWTTSPLHRRFVLLQWFLPFLLGSLAVLYEIGPGRWIHDGSVSVYFDLDIGFYGLVIPLLTFAIMTLLDRWLKAKEQAEKQARTSEQRLIAIMSASADAIISVDRAGQVETWNRGAEALFGRAAQEIYGKSLAVLFGRGEAAEVEFRWLIDNVRQTGFIQGHETTCCDARGREIAVELTATHLTDEQGQTLGISIILRDITERRNRDAEIRSLNARLNERIVGQTRQLAQKIEELAHANAELQTLDKTRGEFVSVVSHQIRAPLTNMSGAIERMQDACGTLTPTCSRMFMILEQQIGRLERLVKDVLNTAHIEAGELVLHPEPISLMPVVRQVIEQTHARRFNRPFRVETKPGLPLVFADRDRVSEVLANLLDNADKYSPSTQEVVIELRATQTEVILSVSDHGPGLRPQDKDHIFEKFYRADNSDSQSIYGYGLGLYVCRQLIEAQRGRIWAENGLDGGAIFCFALPAAS